MDYLLHLFVLIGIYATLSASLDLLVGQTGLLSVAHAAFYSVGAYSSALMAVRMGMPFPVGVLVGMALASLLALVVALPSFRLHEDYFVIATFCFQMILFNVINNWIDLTRGPLGIPGIPQPYIFGWVIRSRVEYVVLTIAMTVVAYGVVGRLAGSSFGRVLRAIREDEVLTQAFGKNPLRFKTTAYAVSAALAASAGSLYAHYITYIDPSSFTVMESVALISMVILGGAGSFWGPLVGATILVTLPEALRFVGLPISVAANLRQFFYGTLLVVMMMVRPRGLVGRYGFER